MRLLLRLFFRDSAKGNFLRKGVFLLPLFLLWGAFSAEGEVCCTVDSAFPREGTNYHSLEDALDAAPPGALLLVAPGRYEVHLEADKNLSLRSSGDLAELLPREGAEEILRIREGCESLELERISFSGEGLDEALVAEASGLSLALKNCVFADLVTRYPVVLLSGSGNRLFFEETLFEENSTLRGCSGYNYPVVDCRGGGTVALEDCTFRNSRMYVGCHKNGVLRCLPGAGKTFSLRVERCTFRNNSHGGLFLGGERNFSAGDAHAVTAEVTNSTFWRNGGAGIALRGEGRNSSCSLTVKNCTFAHNNSCKGSEISCYVWGYAGGAAAAEVRVESSILWEEHSNSHVITCYEKAFGETRAAVRSSVLLRELAQPGSSPQCCFDRVEMEDVCTEDPLVQEPGDHGGSTETCPLPPESPALDKGLGEDAPETDQRGVPRPQGEGIDAGAFEYALPGELTVVLDPEAIRGSGGRWSLDGGLSWRISGESLSLLPGNYTLSFREAEGYVAPEDQKIVLEGEEHLALRGVYTRIPPIPDTPTPLPTNTPIPTVSPAPAHTPVPAVSPMLTHVPGATATPVPEPSPVPTSIVEPSATPAPTEVPGPLPILTPLPVTGDLLPSLTVTPILIAPFGDLQALKEALEDPRSSTHAGVAEQIAEGLALSGDLLFPELFSSSSSSFTCRMCSGEAYGLPPVSLDRKGGEVFVPAVGCCPSLCPGESPLLFCMVKRCALPVEERCFFGYEVEMLQKCSRCDVAERRGKVFCGRKDGGMLRGWLSLQDQGPWDGDGRTGVVSGEYLCVVALPKEVPFSPPEKPSGTLSSGGCSVGPFSLVFLLMFPLVLLKSQ